MIQPDKDYIHINGSFKRKVVFRVGLDAGFFSEYNNMILAMAWCLRNEYEFQLFSKNSNFGYDKGWTDYFIPFCTEVYTKFHLKYNHRPYPYGAPKYFPYFIRQLKKYNLWDKKFDYTPPFYRLQKKIGFGKLLTQDIFEIVRQQNPNEKVDIAELGFSNNFRNLCRLLTDLTWRFNQETQLVIDEMIKELDLPSNYVGFHIRGGDKFVEYPLVHISSYIKKAEMYTEIRNAFVLTDDYRLISELRTAFPEWRFYTLCQPQEKGYYHAEFMKVDMTDRKKSHIRLFSSMVVLEKSSHFIGTFSSNPGMFLGMRMLPENCHGVDFDEWKIW